jgi:hypothetical protein
MDSLPAKRDLDPRDYRVCKGRNKPAVVVWNLRSWIIMRRRKIAIYQRMSRLRLERVLRTWAKLEGALVRPMGRLVRRYKTEGENMHWHLKGLRKGMGTVEVTYLPSAGTAAVIVHENRKGFWAGRAYLRLALEIKKKTRQT